MSRVIYPNGLKAAAQQLGVTLPDSEKFDAYDDVLDLAADLNPGSDFGGFSFKKLVRGVGRGLKKIVKNPVVQVLNPAAAIAIHTTSKAVTGKGTIKGAIGRAVDTGTSVVVGKVNPMAQLSGKFGAGLSGVAKGLSAGKVVAFGVPNKAITPKHAMAAADKLLGDKNVANAAAVVRNTKALAAMGDPSARRGLSVLQAVGHIRVAKKVQPGQKAIPALSVNTKPLTIQRTPAQVKILATKQVAAQPKGFWSRVLSVFNLEVKK